MLNISPTTLLFLSAPSTVLLSYKGDDSPNPKDLILPPNAKPGECYVKLFVPEQYETKEIKQLVKDAETKIEIVPATYKTVSENILVKPAYTTWKKGRGEIKKVDNSTGEIMCLVEVPAVYETVTKQVLDTPATTKEVKIPAICKMVTTNEIDTPAKELKTEIPAIYTMVPTKVKVSDSYFKWQPILCETNTTKDVISNLQKALKSRNYQISNINGEYNNETKEAVKAYQKDNKLNQGALTLETLKSLGL